MFASQSRKTTTLPAFWLNSGRWLPGLPGGTVRTSSRLFLTSYNVPLSLWTSFYARLCCSSKWSNEKTSWGKRRSTSGTFRPRAKGEVGLTPLVVAIDELTGGFWRKQKSRADRFAYSDSLKRSLKWRYSCSCFRSSLAL